MSTATLRATIRTVIFHKQPIVGSGIAKLLSNEPLVGVVDIVTRSSSLADAVARERPRVVVLGVAECGPSRPGRLIRQVRETCLDQDPAFVVLVSGDQDAADALVIDAAAVVTTGVSGAILGELVRSAADSESRLLPTELVRPHAVPMVHDEDSDSSMLTARESEVLRGIENGLSTKAIAEHLGISVNTTRTHAQRLMSKLRVHSRLQAAALAAEQPLLVARGMRS